MSFLSSILVPLSNLLQDAIISIPYFFSSKPTTTIAIHLQNCTRQQEEQIQKIIQQNNQISAHVFKLYYDRQISHKSAILQFRKVQSAVSFYNNFANHKVNAKFELSYCKNINSAQLNMQNILYKMGIVSIQVPESTILTNIIKQISKVVIVEGIRAEQQLLQLKNLVQTRGCLDFIDPRYISSEANYYRWRVYSYLQGDGDKESMSAPFQIMENGPFYHPPTTHSQKYQHRILSFEERKYFNKLLEQVNTRKYYIEEAMAFCVMNGASAVEICCIISVQIVEASREEQVRLNGKRLIGLFYLISDVLFNSPNTIYRDIFMIILPLILDKVPTSGEVNVKIRDLVQIWNKKFIFEEQFLKGIAMLLEGNLPSMKPKGMQQMTRSEHQNYQKLIQLSIQEIEQSCWKNGLAFSHQKSAECLRNLTAILSANQNGHKMQMEPQIGEFDGQALNDKDIQKIKTKSCKIVSCGNHPISKLF